MPPQGEARRAMASTWAVSPRLLALVPRKLVISGLVLMVVPVSVNVSAAACGAVP